MNKISAASAPSAVYMVWHHPWVVCICNLLLVFFIYTLSRLFYFFVNHDIFSNVTFSHLVEMCVGGMRFDVTAIFYINSLYMILQFIPFPFRQNHRYQKTAKWIFWITNVVGILANSIDTVYSRFTGRRTTILFFSEFKNDSNLFDIFFKSIFQYWYVSLFAIMLMVLLIVLTRKLVYLPPYPVLRSRRICVFLCETGLCCLSIYFVVIGIRSGFGAFTRPLAVSNAFLYTKIPVETNIVLNTPFSLIRTVGTNIIEEPSYFSRSELENIYSPLHFPTGDVLSFSKTRKKNVVIFILESFSKEYFGFFNRSLENGTYQGYTPFLDSLLECSITFCHSFSSGRKSIDAMPSILSSIPRFGHPFILTSYVVNDVEGVAAYLHNIGYRSAFFHGAPNGSMGFQAFANSIGFDRYYGKTEYNNNDDFDGYWAIWDEEFLQFFADVMDTMQQPFITSVFTATSHHPFNIPRKYANTFPQGPHPIHQCIGYTDNALKKFFDHAKKQPWFDNTLFVFTADHTNVLTYPQYLNEKGVYEVPIIFYDPVWSSTPDCSYLLGQNSLTNTTPISHCDILPSILEYVGYDLPYFSFGENVLTTSKEHPFVVLYNEPIYQCFSDSILVQFDGEKIISIFDYQKDVCLDHNLLNTLLTTDEVVRMERFMKAYIQQYKWRMVSNKLTADTAKATH